MSPWAGRRAVLAWGVAIVLAALLAFQPALHDQFVHDDVPQVKELALPRDSAGWALAWLQPWWPAEYHKNLWRPVTRVGILLQKVVAGEVAWPFHAVNLALHGAACLLLFAVALRLGLSLRAAGAGTMLFAVHPLHAEAVHQIVGQAELWATVWMLAGLLAFLRRGYGRGAWLAQPLFYALALGSKEHAVVYPLLVALAALVSPVGEAAHDGETASPVSALLRRLRDRRLCALLGLLCLVLLAFLGGKAWVSGGLMEKPGTIPYHENPLAQMGLAARLPAVLGILGYATSRLAWPAGLSPDYSAFSLPFEQGWAWGWGWVGVVLAVAAVAFAWRSLRRGGRGWVLVVAGLASYLVTSNGPFVIGVNMAERLWYWPSVAACLGAGWALERLAERLPAQPRRLGNLLFLLVVALLLSASWRYAPAWRTQKDYALWTVERFPHSWRGHNNLAREYYLEKNFTLGLDEARLATDLLPNLGIGWDWVGVNAMFLPGHEAEAEAAFARALALEPKLHEVHRHWANLLESQGRRAEARTQLEAYLPYAKPEDRAKIEQRLARLRR